MRSKIKVWIIFVWRDWNQVDSNKLGLNDDSNHAKSDLILNHLAKI